MHKIVLGTERCKTRPGQFSFVVKDGLGNLCESYEVFPQNYFLAGNPNLLQPMPFMQSFRCSSLCREKQFPVKVVGPDP